MINLVIKIIKNPLLIFILIIPFYSYALSFENKIVLKIENEIITNIDISNETNYLKALNPNLNNLDESKLILIGKNSLIRQKIKEIEISKHNMNEISSDYLNDVIKSIYTKINLSNKEEFINYLEKFNVKISDIEKKLYHEAQWNQLVYNKFYTKLKINEDEIRKDINRNKFTINSYRLSEIVYTANQNSEAEELYKKIKKSILDDGFENAAALYSTSQSSKNGGDLGWINENSVNKKILKNISKLEIGKYTNPILIPGGFLILKIKDKKQIKKEIDFEKELDLRIRSLQNQQLNQYSNIYFNKVKKDIVINEK
jgi:peptidyl-prolyl cis-trans isomerase SurA